MRSAASACTLLACTWLSVAPAQAADGWSAAHAVDPVTDAVRDGAIYTAGGDRFLAICTHNKGARDRFWISVQTDAALGRRGVRPLTYRVGEEPATTSQWDYRPREAMPVWPLEDRHIVQRLLAAKADRLVLRLTTYDDKPHDLVVPLDDPARDGLAKALAACG